MPAEPTVKRTLPLWSASLLKKLPWLAAFVCPTVLFVLYGLVVVAPPNQIDAIQWDGSSLLIFTQPTWQQQGDDWIASASVIELSGTFLMIAAAIFLLLAAASYFLAKVVLREAQPRS